MGMLPARRVDLTTTPRIYPDVAASVPTSPQPWCPQFVIVRQHEGFGKGSATDARRDGTIERWRRAN